MVEGGGSAVVVLRVVYSTWSKRSRTACGGVREPHGLEKEQEEGKASIRIGDGTGESCGSGIF